nr:ATP-binding protein [Spirochaetaceae bacterium]
VNYFIKLEFECSMFVIMRSNQKSNFKISDTTVIKIHDYLYTKHRYINMFFTIALYAAIIFLWGEKLTISSNYFIFLPLIVISISFGFTGGLIAGIFALPSNLFLFYLTGHPEYSPESHIIAEIFGILVGSVMGYISDFFTKMKKEIQRRMISEIALEKTIKEKEILLKEISHRVKNNLNLIKSIIQLQANRIKSIKQKEELNKLNQRIMSIAIVQDLLFAQDSLDMLDFRKYLNQLVENLLSGYIEKNISFTMILCENPIYLESKKITSIGLIVNEAITNTIKYAFKDAKRPKLTIKLTQSIASFHLSIKDNGPGYPEEMRDSGLGLKLIKTLTKNLEGDFSVQNNNGGEMILNIPLTGMYEETY